jgi:hypothetical protein
MHSTTVGNQIAPIVVGVPGWQESWTFAQFEAAMCRNFIDQIKSKAYLRSLRVFDANIRIRAASSAYFDISNSGCYATDGKIVDMFLVQSFSAACSIVSLELDAATTYSKRYDRQFFRLAYSQSVFTRSDVRKIWTALIHACQNHRPNLTVKEAIADLRGMIEKTASKPVPHAIGMFH